MKAFLIACLLPTLLLCRFTVRDIGFVELNTSPWTMVLVVDSEEAGQDELRAMHPLLRDSNVSMKVVVNAEQAPAWLLRGVAAEDSLLVELNQPELTKAEKEAAREQAVQRALDSPLRQRLVTEAADAFAFVVIVEGKSADPSTEESLGANADADPAQVANESAQEAVSLLHQIEAQLPRPLAGDVRIVSLPFQQRPAESISLWAAGLKDLPEQETAVVIYYGRLKRAAPPLRGEYVSTNSILQQLALIGESCECETDRDWAAEPTLPHRWTMGDRDRIADSLGFDPESPMVIAEINRILMRGPLNRTAQPSTQGLAGLVLGYREDAVASGTDQLVAEDAPKNDSVAPIIVEQGEGDWGFADEEASTAVEEESDGVGSKTAVSETIAYGTTEKGGAQSWLYLLGLAVLSIAGASWVLLKRGRSF
ncbi:MAG: hypothetical protein GY747_04215 [Planctomycetes bacterium]|nr:hypothetical protein [Planctomycetota bacterium]MCP4770487.1 hypothetical protein [Planctomycetota bacterium]MCP4859927.1 hypothetical protein [Planctomycetota bacterium]